MDKYGAKDVEPAADGERRDAPQRAERARARERQQQHRRHADEEQLGGVRLRPRRRPRRVGGGAAQLEHVLEREEHHHEVRDARPVKVEHDRQVDEQRHARAVGAPAEGCKSGARQGLLRAGWNGLCRGGQGGGALRL